MYEAEENGAIDDALVKEPSGQELLLYALYPYSYEMKSGLQISFEAGDSFTLVEKSNNDWWHVCKDGKTFYVPANYVCETRDNVDAEHEDILSTGSSNSQGDINALSPSSESSSLDFEESTDKEAIEECTSFGGNDSERIYENIPVHVKNEFVRNYISAGDCVQQVSPFRRPKSATLPSGWIVDMDNSTGRPHFINTRTNETKLKPPRAKPVHSEDDTSRHSFSLPRGWRLERQQSEREEYLYVNESNNEMWQASQDETGRIYYYNVHGGNSCWELPLCDDVNTLKVPGNDLNRRFPRCRISSEGADTSVVHLRNKSPQLHLRGSKSASLITGLDASVEMISFSKGHQRTSSDQMRNSLTMTDDFPPAPLMPELNYTVKKEGIINRKKLCDKGFKKIRKVTWSPCYVKLSSSNMIIYKNQSSATPKPGCLHGRPESSCDLRGAVIEKMPDETKKRNIFQVATLSKLCFLIQVDDVCEFADWYHMIFDVIKYLSESQPVERGMQAKLYDDLASKPQGLMAAFPSKVSFKKFRDGDKKNIRDKLKKLMSKRPTIEELHKKGIMKDITFGCHISKLCEREQTKIPHVVTRCIEAIEAKGLDFDGLYRISGNVSSIQQLRISVDQEETAKFGDRPFDDVHVLTGTLKLYFRELPEPLFPFDSYATVITAIKKATKQEKTTTLHNEINNIPSPNIETLRYLFKHLRRVMENSQKNRMHAKNIAIVFGPTLLAPREEIGDIAVNMVYQNHLIEYILLEYDDVLA